jgi:hypothetical protein
VRKVLRLRFLIPALALAGLLLLAAQNGPTSLDSIITYAELHGQTPDGPRLAAGKHHNDPRNVARRQMQKDFAVKQKADAKAFSKQLNAKNKTALKAQEKTIRKNPDLSKNQQKAAIKAIQAQQKAQNKSILAEFKAQQKQERKANNLDIKAVLKAMFG